VCRLVVVGSEVKVHRVQESPDGPSQQQVLQREPQEKKKDGNKYEGAKKGEVVQWMWSTVVWVIASSVEM
jgi:hypothetical protein